MNPIFTSIIVNNILEKKKQKPEKERVYSRYEIAKGFKDLKITAFRLLKDIFLITAGIFSAAFGLKGFLLTNNFIDGGATGISLLVTALTHTPLYIMIICINAPFILLAFKIIGKGFAIKTVISILGLALCLATVEFPDVTMDNFLVSVFGGFFLGAGIGLSVRGGAVLDGTEVLAIFLSKKLFYFFNLFLTILT